MVQDTIEEKEEELNMKEESHVYELGFHLLPTLKEDKLPEAVATIKSDIESAGGVTIAEEFPKSIELAYRMTSLSGVGKESFDSAYFGWIKFELPKSDITNLKEKLANNADLLRYLILRTVRESTLAPRRAFLGKTESEPRKESPRIKAPRKEEAGTSSEAEIEEAVRELVEQTKE